MYYKIISQEIRSYIFKLPSNLSENEIEEIIQDWPENKIVREGYHDSQTIDEGICNENGIFIDRNGNEIHKGY